MLRKEAEAPWRAAQKRAAEADAGVASLQRNKMKTELGQKKEGKKNPTKSRMRVESHSRRVCVFLGN